MKSKLEEIAKNTLHINTLETRSSDELDFHELSVWELKAALEAAYKAGQADIDYGQEARLTYNGKDFR